MSFSVESDEFPLLCATCLGENPMIRMTKQNIGKPCKICDRPFPVYRWKPGPRARYKKTELCRSCAKLKNVCQTCVLDLVYGLPVQLRDSGMAEEEKLTLPTSEVGRALMLEQYEKQMQTAATHGNTLDTRTGTTSSTEHTLSITYGKLTENNPLLTRLSRPTPYYKRNEAHLCSFFARGECNRGALCPFRHEMPQKGDLAKQNIRDRYIGHNDPVALKMLGRKNTQGGLDPMLFVPPSDPKITTLFISGVEANVLEEELYRMFYPYGELSRITILSSKHCAFITFLHRSSAEEASKKAGNACAQRGWRLSWGKPKKDKQQQTQTETQEQQQGEQEEQVGQQESQAAVVSSSVSSLSSLSPSAASVVFPPLLPPPGLSAPTYPSQHPSASAAKFNT